MLKKITLFLLAVLLLALFALPSCKTLQEDNFKITLADSGEVVLTGNDIAAYNAEECAFELNESGIKKWNSYHTYQTIPKLNETLFSRDFILTIEGQEICRGKFWSYASSSFCSGVTILESLFKLDDENNQIIIRFGFPSVGLPEEDIQAALIDHFEKADRLK